MDRVAASFGGAKLLGPDIKTNMAPLRGWAQRGQRIKAKVPRAKGHPSRSGLHADARASVQSRCHSETTERTTVGPRSGRRDRLCLNKGYSDYRVEWTDDDENLIRLPRSPPSRATGRSPRSWKSRCSDA